MNVRELFEHFFIVFDAIHYNDITHNAEDVIYTTSMDERGKKTYDEEKQNEFVGEYGDYEVLEWEYRCDDTIVLRIRMPEEECE